MKKSVREKLKKKKTDQEPVDSRGSESGSTEPTVIRLRCDSSSCSSKNFSLISSRTEIPSTSKILYLNDKKKEAKSSKNLLVDESLFRDSSSEASKKSPGQKSRKSTERFEEDFSLRKVTETMNLSLTDCESNQKNVDGLPRAVERLNLKTEKSVRPDITKTDAIFSESLLNDLKYGRKGGQDFECSEQRPLQYVPLEQNKIINEGGDKLSQEFEERKKIVGFKSWFPTVTKPQTAAFFFQKLRFKPKKKKVKRFDVVEEPYVGPEVTPEEDLATKRSLREFFFYIFQLIVITTIALSMVSSSMYYLSDITASLFLDTVNAPIDPANDSASAENTSKPVQRKSLRESTTVEDFWAFAETTLINLLYWDFLNARMNPRFHKEKDDKLLRENQVLGVARIRQVRVKSDSCAIHPDVKRFFDSCYSHYSVYAEDTDPIEGGGGSTPTAWTFTEAKDLNTTYYWGEISIYGGSGYYLDLDKEKEGAKKQIEELKNGDWVSRGTRAVFIDFNIYNANVNLFCICKIVVEFSPVGGLIASSDFHSLKLIRYLTIFDFFVLGLEFVYIIFLCDFSYTLFMKFYRKKRLFFLSFWNYVDLVILALSVTYIILSFIRYFFVEDLISKLKDNYNSYTEFQLVKNIQMNYNNVIAVLLFFSWMKLFTFMTFTKIMMQFRITLARSIKDIIGFFPMFLTMFLAFSFLAYLLFGDQVEHYNSVWYSFLALFQAFLGEFNYSSVLESHHILGPLFYIAFVFFIFFVLLNVFIAIINDAYQTVKSQVISNPPLTGEYIRRACRNICYCCRTVSRKKLYRNIGRKQVLFNEIIQTLKKAGFCSEEIRIFFTKYDINFKNYLSESTKRRIIKDLELKRIDYNETSEQYQINVMKRRVEELKNQIESLEVKLQPVIDKVDALFYRV